MLRIFKNIQFLAIDRKISLRKWFECDRILDFDVSRIEQVRLRNRLKYDVHSSLQCELQIIETIPFPNGSRVVYLCMNTILKCLHIADVCACSITTIFYSMMVI